MPQARRHDRFHPHSFTQRARHKAGLHGRRTDVRRQGADRLERRGRVDEAVARIEAHATRTDVLGSGR